MSSVALDSSDDYKNNSPVVTSYKGLMKQHTGRVLIQLFVRRRLSACRDDS